MEGICVNYQFGPVFFRFLKGRCHGSQFWAKFAKMAIQQVPSLARGMEGDGHSIALTREINFHNL